MSLRGAGASYKTLEGAGRERKISLDRPWQGWRYTGDGGMF